MAVRDGYTALILYEDVICSTPVATEVLRLRISEVGTGMWLCQSPQAAPAHPTLDVFCLDQYQSILECHLGKVRLLPANDAVQEHVDRPSSSGYGDEA